MDNCFSNATVMWDNEDIAKREALILEIPILLNNVWRALNRSFYMERCETPVIVPESVLKSHIDQNFELIKAGERGYLRPETTAGTYEVFRKRFPQQNQIKKNLPLCLWQVGLSFRDESNPDTMRASKLRLIQFYQMEFQIFCSEDTKAPYLEKALQALCLKYGGEVADTDDLPHYSEFTLDWHLNGLEVAGCSKRKDWDHGTVFEVAIGLDRLVANLGRGC